MSRTTNTNIKSNFQTNKISRLLRLITTAMSNISAPALPGSVSSGLTRVDTRWTSTSPSRTTTTSSPSSASPRSSTAVSGRAMSGLNGTRMASSSPGTEMRARTGTSSSTGHPRLTPKTASKMSFISSNNQSLIIMDVKKEDSGRFTCVAESGAGFRVSHTTRLESFPPPVFSHPPIWNSRPEDTMVGAYMLIILCYCPSVMTCQVTEGESVELVCSVTVGQQYNTVSMLPVYADWDWERWVGRGLGRCTDLY